MTNLLLNARELNLVAPAVLSLWFLLHSVCIFSSAFQCQGRAVESKLIAVVLVQMLLIYKVIISRVLSHCFEVQFSATVRFSILEYFLLHKISSLFIFLFRRCRRCVREINLCPRVQFQGWMACMGNEVFPPLSFHDSVTLVLLSPAICLKFSNETNAFECNGDIYSVSMLHLPADR